jgi:hypothetical protein
MKAESQQQKSNTWEQQTILLSITIGIQDIPVMNALNYKNND